MRVKVDSWNMVDMMKCFCALLVHATPDGKVRISKETLQGIPSNFGNIIQVEDLGDAYLIRILGLEELEKGLILSPQGIVLPSGRAGPKDRRPVIKVN